jgi:hypothetical protein
MDSIFSSVIGTEVTVTTYIICLACSMVCGVIAAFAAAFRSRVSKSFLVALVLLPMIVHTVITMVNGNIGTGVAVMGAFSLVRFRSVPGKAKDIVAIFLAMTAGLACASGFVGIAIMFSLIVCAAAVVLSFVRLGEDRLLLLNITVPESLNIAHGFDDIFTQYTKKHRLVSTKTTNMGSLYKLTYKVEMKDKDKAQEFIDAIRCRNGNLEILLTEAPDTEEL